MMSTKNLPLDLSERRDAGGASPVLEPVMSGEALIPEVNLCFGCGPTNPVGLHLEFEVRNDADAAPTSVASITLSRHYEGGPQRIHGGILVTLLDEAMTKLNRPLQVTAMTRHIAVDYLRPAPVEAPLTVRGWHVRREGRKLFHAAAVEDRNGVILARAEGVFIAVGP